MGTAYATVKGLEIMGMIRKGLTKPYHIYNGVKGEIRLIEQCFGIGNSSIADAVAMLKNAFKNEPNTCQQMNVAT